MRAWGSGRFGLVFLACLWTLRCAGAGCSGPLANSENPPLPLAWSLRADPRELERYLTVVAGIAREFGYSVSSVSATVDFLQSEGLLARAYAQSYSVRPAKFQEDLLRGRLSYGASRVGGDEYLYPAPRVRHLFSAVDPTRQTKTVPAVMAPGTENAENFPASVRVDVGPDADGRRDYLSLTVTCLGDGAMPWAGVVPRDEVEGTRIESFGPRLYETLREGSAPASVP